ncbi:MAG: hypothetical protein IPF98_22715 [Gemmatimonadetes bacterium]|nr:hypothetical protein [Gemmatimonadota bacterium]
MIVKGPYDYLEEAEKELLRARAGTEIVRHWLPAPPGTTGPGTLREETIHHPARIETERSRLANDTQLAVERAGWRRFEQQAVQEVERDPRPYFEEVASTRTDRPLREDPAVEPQPSPRQPA